MLCILKRKAKHLTLLVDNCKQLFKIDDEIETKKMTVERIYKYLQMLILVNKVYVQAVFCPYLIC